MAEYMGEYKIIRRMDGGGNANVFVAENARGEEVAIKILREESGNGKKAVKRNRKKRIRFKITILSSIWKNIGIKKKLM